MRWRERERERGTRGDPVSDKFNHRQVVGGQIVPEARQEALEISSLKVRTEVVLSTSGR
jgi:hypothetical protein